MIVRTNIVIDDDFIDEALRVTGLKNKKVGGRSCSQAAFTSEKIGISQELFW